ncbi:MAG: fasciclin domain-containing protein, partial [Bacteroidales bacterium]|nr:fasciclin domain-containing protein [Bacteroidales bacterium]
MILTLTGCKDIYDQDKYQHPDWLAGKLYTQISAEEDLTIFKRCLELSGYDTIIDRTGSFTVFAPNDEAFAQYFSTHPEYGGNPENIPLDELIKLVRIHIIQDAWTLNQIQLLDVGGWIDKNDPNNDKPRGYKRQSLYRDPDTKYWVDYSNGNYEIVDSTESNDYRIVYSRSRKYVPIFFPEFFSVFGLSGDDYDFYFDRPFDNSTIHYVNAKVLGDEIFAENGFIFEVDQVVEPLMNVEQILHSTSPGRSYQYVIDLLRLFPDFKSDLDETRNQPAAKAGLNFDTLYTLNYPDLPFNVHEELTGPNTNVEEYTLRYHNGF